MKTREFTSRNGVRYISQPAQPLDDGYRGGSCTGCAFDHNTLNLHHSECVRADPCDAIDYEPIGIIWVKKNG